MDITSQRGWAKPHIKLMSNGNARVIYKARAPVRYTLRFAYTAWYGSVTKAWTAMVLNHNHGYSNRIPHLN